MRFFVKVVKEMEIQGDEREEGGEEDYSELLRLDGMMLATSNTQLTLLSFLWWRVVLLLCLPGADEGVDVLLCADGWCVGEAWDGYVLLVLVDDVDFGVVGEEEVCDLH